MDFGRMIDKAIMVIAPAIAVKRMANRQRGEMIGRKYEGAGRNPRTGSFPLNNLSPNKDIGADATLLRQRLRYMFQNSHTAKRAINSLSNGVVGTGITPGFRIGYDEKSDKASKQLDVVKDLWRKWGECLCCDFYGRLNFFGLTKLATKTTVRDGEVLALRRRVPLSESPIGIQIQVLEMEYLADYINYQVLPNGGWTMNGIEYDKRGKRVAYWLFQRHPSEWYTQPVRILADDIIHVLHVDFAGQNRGVGNGASTIIAERDLDEYEDAELMAKKTQASFAAFRVTNDPDKWEGNISTDRKDYDSDEDLEMLEPGTISHLYPGEDIKFSTPPTAPGAEDFRKSKYRAIAAGYGVMYEAMTGDLSNVNFSSYRAGRIDFQQTVEDIQWMTIIPIFCQGVMEWFFEALLTCPGGLMKLPDGLNVTWTTPRRDLIDPAKEMGAIKNETRMGRKSWQQMIRENGDDPDEVFKQIVEDKKRFEDAGIHAEWSADLDAVPSDAGKLTATGK